MLNFWKIELLYKLYKLDSYHARIWWESEVSEASPALIVSIYGLNASFEMQFQEHLGEKIFPVGPFFGLL